MSSFKSSPNIENLEQKNLSYSSFFTQGHLELPPAKKYLVVTCMDARIDPASAFGIELGDAHVIRNAGASAQDALRSIIISQQLLGTKEIILVKHTGCGMLTFTNEQAYSIIDKNLGSSAIEQLKDIKLDFLPFPELNQAVKDDVAYLKSTPLIPDQVVISGWVYEVESGKVTRVV